jgi:hypothetical protein
MNSLPTPKTEVKPVRGTAEWAVATVDCCRGCPHGCRYCYARHDLVERRRLVTAAQWQFSEIIEEEVEKMRPLYAGRVMFLEIYRQLRHNPLIRWKESIKTVVGLDLAAEPGLDI